MMFGNKKDDKHRPETLANLLKTYLKESGLEQRVEQAEIIPEWPALVGAPVAQRTRRGAADGRVNRQLRGLGQRLDQLGRHVWRRHHAG